MSSEYDQLYLAPPLKQTLEGSVAPVWATPTLRRRAAYMLWMPSVDRDALRHPDTPCDVAAPIIARAKEQTTRKVSHLGLSLYNYFDSFEAFRRGDILALHTIEQSAARRVPQDTQTGDTKSENTDHTGAYLPSRKKFHESIVSYLQRRLRPSAHPVLHIVMGPFGVGKSEKLRDKFITGEPLYVSDPDGLRQQVMPEYDPSNHTHVARTAREVADISDLGFYRALTKRFSMLCETSLRNPDWWQQMIQRVTADGYRVELHMATRPLHDCFRRVIAARDRPARVGDYLDLTKRYSNFLTLMHEPRIKKVTVAGMKSADGMLPEDCPLTGGYVRAISHHPRVTEVTTH